MAEEHDTLAQQLADTRWVAGLARRLCHDAAAADDLAQDTWLRALEARRDAAADPASAPRSRGWFHRVLLNNARQRARSDARRGARERSVARPEAQPADDLVARAEASTRLVAHVLALDEPYRRVILARYFDGLAPEGVARRTGVNASTVRTRIERGLALLRTRLERDGGPSWLAAFAPLALGPLPVAPLIPVATTTAALPLFVGVTMALTAKLALAAAALGIGLYFVWPEREPASDAPLAVDRRSKQAIPESEIRFWPAPGYSAPRGTGLGERAHDVHLSGCAAARATARILGLSGGGLGRLGTRGEKRRLSPRPEPQDRESTCGSGPAAHARWRRSTSRPLSSARSCDSHSLGPGIGDHDCSDRPG